MSITDTLERAKESLAELKQNRKFKKANMKRQEQTELQTALANCSGKLEICKKDFNRTIKNQTRNIREGKSIGMDVQIQEGMLWDAAIGYMLVRDAIFSLRSINSHESVAHAYEMLDEAVRVMSGKRSSALRRITKEQDRNRFGYVTSQAALREKEDLLDTFFAELELTGDIETCLANALDPKAIGAARRNSLSNDPEMERARASLERLKQQNSAAEEDENILDSMGDAVLSVNPKD